MDYEQIVERGRSDREHDYVQVERGETRATVTLNDPGGEQLGAHPPARLPACVRSVRGRVGT
jgi:hypothetical protein